MPTNKKFDRNNPKNKYVMQQGVPVEDYPYEGPFAPRFEPRRVGGSTETEVALPVDTTGITPARVISTVVEPQVFIEPLTVQPNHRSLPFYRRRYQTVTALSEATLIDIQTGGATTYYIKRIGTTFTDNTVEFRLEYDDTVWLTWNFQIGGVSGVGSMYELHSALPVRKRARLIVRNLAAESRLYEAVIDGWHNETAGVSEEKGGFN